MGGGDLNLKKSWHPLTMRNQERVWKEEQRVQEEQRKLEQLRKEIAQERARDELIAMQEKAGLVKRSDRVDWLYAVPAGASSSVSTDKEEYLLGKKRAEHALAEQAKETSTSSQAAAHPFDSISLSNPNANTVRDLMSKVREDPLFAIRKREQETIQEMASNPLLVKKIKGKSKDKTSKKEKKKKSRRSSRSRSRSRSPPSQRRHSRSRSRSPDGHGYHRSASHRERSRSPRSYSNRDMPVRPHSPSHGGSSRHHRRDDSRDRPSSPRASLRYASRHSMSPPPRDRRPRSRSPPPRRQESPHRAPPRPAYDRRDDRRLRQFDRHESPPPPRSTRRVDEFGRTMRDTAPPPRGPSPPRRPDGPSASNKLKEEERQARLAAMMQSAKQVEEDRLRYHETARLAAEREEQALAQRASSARGSGAGFSSMVYGASSGGSGVRSVADAISRNKFYLDKRSDRW